jgi:two-component system NtrC family sensor kinase
MTRAHTCPTDYRPSSALAGPLLLWLILLLAGVPVPALCFAESAPSQRIVITDATGAYPLGARLAILEDPGKTLTLEDVMHPDRTARFRPSTEDVPGFGFNRSAFWVAIDIERRTSSDEGWVLEFDYAPMQLIDVYTVSGDGRVSHQRGGARTPIHAREFPHYKHVFPIALPMDAVTRLYVRTETHGSQNIPLALYRLDSFAVKSSIDAASLSLYTGVIIALFFYNLFLYYNIREASYLYYLGSMVSFLMTILSIRGVAQAALSDVWPGLSDNILPLSVGLGNAFGGLFTAAFLESKRIMGRWHLLMIAFIVTGVIAGIAPWIIGYRTGMILGAGLTMIHPVVALIFAVVAVRKGNSAARYYLIAWTMFLISSMMYALKTIGWLPSNILTENALVWGSAAEVILLSIALSARMRTMKEQMDAAQAATLTAQQESITNKQIALDTVQKYNARLETDVKQRTEELIATQQKLIASEKMSALGVFTAGMAHEINNPANFASVGVQNAMAQTDSFSRFVGDLLSDDADADIRREFDDHSHKIRQSHTTIHEGIQRIERVVRQLRADHPEGHTGMQAADVIASLESAWSTLAPTVTRRIRTVIDAEARPRVPCNIAELHQVFLALLSNAAHAIEDAASHRSDATEGMIDVKAYTDNETLIITVTDNGIGIPADRLDKIFDPFFTTRTVGRGSGLGLSMARDVVLRHGGTLDASSTPGQGSTFSLRLPLHGAGLTSSVS